MATPPHSLALRDALDRLSGMRPDDRAEILAFLDPLTRIRVEKMLMHDENGAEPAAGTSWQHAGFSEAMLTRFRTGGGMTADAHALLRRCADDMAPRAAAATAPHSPSLFQRIGTVLTKRTDG